MQITTKKCENDKYENQKTTMQSNNVSRLRTTY